MSEAKLMTPLFHGGNFNAAGKKMKAVFLREVSNGTDAYRLWRRYGAPDLDYPRAENDTHILYIEVGGYLAPLRMTEYGLIGRCGTPPAVETLYGGEEGREKYFNALRETGQAYTEAIPAALAKEEEAIRRLGVDPVRQADYIKILVDQHVSVYLSSKESGGASFPDFIGAAVLDELAQCRELSSIYKAKTRAEREARRAKVEAEEKKRREEVNREAERQIHQATHVLRFGGVLENQPIRFYREDGGIGKYSIVNHLMRLYGVDVPLRTQGWINEKLVSVTVRDGRCTNIRYLKSNGGRCSEKFFECIDELIRKTGEEPEAA